MSEAKVNYYPHSDIFHSPKCPNSYAALSFPRETLGLLLYGVNAFYLLSGVVRQAFTLNTKNVGARAHVKYSQARSSWAWTRSLHADAVIFVKIS